MLSIDQSLKEWSKEIGFKQEDNTPGLTLEQIEELTPVHMRPVWKHVIRHVRPKQEVEMIRKNLLLNRLRKEKMSDKKVTMALGSADHLEKYLEMNETEKKNKATEKDEDDLRKTIKAMVVNSKLKKAQLRHKTEKLYEVTTKSEIFKIKAKTTEDKIKELVQVEGIINELKPPALESSLEEHNENKKKITECIPKIKEYVKIRRSIKLTEEEKKKEYESVSDFVRENTFAIPTNTSVTTLTDLISTSNYNMKVMAEQTVTEDPEVTKAFSCVGDGLVELSKTHVQLKRQVAETKKLLSDKIKELEECQEELSSYIEKLLNIADEDNDSKNCISEYVKNTSQLVVLEEEPIAFNESINAITNENRLNRIEQFDTDSLERKLVSVKKEFYAKSEVVARCKDSLKMTNDRFKIRRKDIQKSVTKTLTVHFNNTSNNPIPAFQESLLKEVELFMVVPHVAISRSWESNLELDYKTKQEVLNTSLAEVFSHPDANCLKYVLDLICWSETLKKHKNFDHFETREGEKTSIVSFNYDMKKMMYEIEKVENEAQKLETIVHFWKDQPLENYVPEELQLDGVGYSVWKDRKIKSGVDPLVATNEY